ncbi:MAG: DUF2087 domain-containing protein [Clostridiales bacterium]|nr:DUF2087 domain-containing protein [Clostridiales bacterium]
MKIDQQLLPFLDEAGRLKQYPAKRAKQLMALAYLAAKFEPERSYTETEVNELLNEWHNFGDWALLRRDLVDTGYLNRDKWGKAYTLAPREYETTLQSMDLSRLTLPGRVLDIGAGGEGIIARAVGPSVVGIDKRKEELEETADIGLKIVMDACDLQFLAEHFDHVTCFYSLMYMQTGEVQRCLREANRVLKKGGSLWIWDTVIPVLPSETVFIAQVAVKIDSDTCVRTGYGIAPITPRTMEDYIAACKESGFHLRTVEDNGAYFALHAEKM